MELGLCDFRSGDGPLAMRLGATRAHLYRDLTCDEGKASEAGFTALAEDARDFGMAIIADVRTSVGRWADIVADREGARQWYADELLAFLNRHPHVLDVEVWGNAEIVTTLGSPSPVVTYPAILQRVFDRVKTERWDVRVWTGGFGCNANGTFYHEGIAKRAPGAFDRLNLHPFVSPAEAVVRTAEAFRIHLGFLSECLQKCDAGQQIACSGFGVPTTTCTVPPGYGDFLRQMSGNRNVFRLVPEDKAAEWYIACLRELCRARAEVVCLLTRDKRDPDTLHDHAGLCDPDGKPKAFVDEMLERMNEVYVTPEGHATPLPEMQWTPRPVGEEVQLVRLPDTGEADGGVRQDDA